MLLEQEGVSDEFVVLSERSDFLTVRIVGDNSKSAKAEGSLTVTPTGET